MRHSYLLSSALVLENTNILCGRYIMRWRQSSLYDTVPSEIQGQYCCFAHIRKMSGGNAITVLTHILIRGLTVSTTSHRSKGRPGLKKSHYAIPKASYLIKDRIYY